MRIGLRVGDLLDWDSFLEKYNTFVERASALFNISDYDKEAELRSLIGYRDILVENNMIIDTESYLHKAISKGKKILAEGSCALMLDIDFGVYPYVCSSVPSVGGICTGLGIPPQAIETSVGIVRAYMARGGKGNFPTYLDDDVGSHMLNVGNEFGSTAGKPKRCGWLDLNVIQYATMINGCTSLNLTKLDVMTGLSELKICIGYRLGKREYIGEMPPAIENFEKCSPIYENLSGWDEDIG